MKVLKSWNRAANFAKRHLSSRHSRKMIEQNAGQLFHMPVGQERYQAALYFADEMVNAYQIRQWYEPLKTLALEVPTVVIARKPETALALRGECPLPVFYAPTIVDLENLVDSQGLRIVYYVNQNIQNFQMMRFNQPSHVFLCHGESDKSYMWTNQLKAYDYVFSAGQAAVERLSEHLRNFDVQKRTKLVGRPQIDVTYVSPIELDTSRRTVLYAPTWEGDRPTMAYGSVVTHGVKFIESLLSDGQCNIIFRPHPRSGASSTSYGHAVRKIKTMLEQAAESTSAVLYYDDSPDWGWQWDAADICITDISAAAYDFLATGKPLFITKPNAEDAKIANSLALAQIPALSTEHALHVADYVHEAILAGSNDTRRLVNHYFGDVTPGASMRRFINASKELLDDAEHRQKDSDAESFSSPIVVNPRTGLSDPSPVRPPRAA